MTIVSESCRSHLGLPQGSNEWMKKFTSIWFSMKFVFVHAQVTIWSLYINGLFHPRGQLENMSKCIENKYYVVIQLVLTFYIISLTVSTVFDYIRVI